MKKLVIYSVLYLFITHSYATKFYINNYYDLITAIEDNSTIRAVIDLRNCKLQSSIGTSITLTTMKFDHCSFSSDYLEHGMRIPRNIIITDSYLSQSDNALIVLIRDQLTLFPDGSAQFNRQTLNPTTYSISAQESWSCGISGEGNGKGVLLRRVWDEFR